MIDPKHYIAMLRAILSDYQDVISGPDMQRGMDAVDGVEAEIIRLTQERHEVGQDAISYKADLFKEYDRVEKLERALAETREALAKNQDTSTPIAPPRRSTARGGYVKVRRKKLEPACPHELERWYPRVSWWDRLWCRAFGHKWSNCFKHNLSTCERCDYRVEWAEPK